MRGRTEKNIPSKGAAQEKGWIEDGKDFVRIRNGSHAKGKVMINSLEYVTQTLKYSYEKQKRTFHIFPDSLIKLRDSTTLSIPSILFNHKEQSPGFKILSKSRILGAG